MSSAPAGTTWATLTRMPSTRTSSTRHVSIDLERYVPAFFTWIANKLSRGASQHYLRSFGVGIETWRCLVLLAIEPTISANKVCRIIGMDKASVSRCFSGMEARGLIRIAPDPADGRARVATLTEEGRALHDQIIGVALERERALLSVLSSEEREVLIALLRRLHENLPEVEAATDRYVARMQAPVKRSGRPKASKA
ncbi:MarR family winged helix-turn-helix transcriptional regulator [Variovorax sp. LjRoot84]|uniref:MarR family winged helix-turn-helix transcriptional regulator n=1 Tax=Variovorax sp. LjRoot84 TaxID=3342340 RepID=UPI003ECE19BA